LKGVANVFRTEGIEQKVSLNEESLNGSTRVGILYLVSSVAEESASFGPRVAPITMPANFTQVAQACEGLFLKSSIKKWAPRRLPRPHDLISQLD
jgi:hypothetical protein|tara:strand:- start:213 stop:497 length:285 start_codon:yes stop_codon:yes gene_type:complete